MNASAGTESEMGETPRTVKTARAPKPTDEMTPDEKARADAVDLRCLSLCIGMLERVNGVCDNEFIFVRPDADSNNRLLRIIRLSQVC